MLERFLAFVALGLVAGLAGFALLLLRVRRMRRVEASLTEGDRQRIAEEILLWTRQGLGYRERLQRLVDRGMPRDNAEIHLARAEALRAASPAGHGTGAPLTPPRSAPPAPPPARAR